MTISATSFTRSPIPRRKVLIVGVDSAIGTALKKKLVGKGFEAIGSTRQHCHISSERIYLDLQDSRTFTILGRQTFDTVVLCGAITSLHTCEKYPLISKAST